MPSALGPAALGLRAYISSKSLAPMLQLLHGLGACLVHVMDDNSEKPVAYASRTLTKSETAYAQIEREGLALVFGVRHFHQYLYG